MRDLPHLNSFDSHHTRELMGLHWSLHRASGTLWLLLCMHPMFSGAYVETVSFFQICWLFNFFFLICSMCSFWNALTSFFPQWINTCGFLSELQLCLVQTQSLRAAPARGHPWPPRSSQGTSASKVPDPPGPLAGQWHVAAVMFSFRRRGSRVTFCAGQGPADPSRGAHELRLQPTGEWPPSPVSSHSPKQPFHKEKNRW